MSCIFHSNSFADELFNGICWVWDHPSSNRGCVRDELLEPRFIIYYLYCHYLFLIVITFIFVQIGAMSQLRFADLDYILLLNLCDQNIADNVLAPNSEVDVI